MSPSTTHAECGGVKGKGVVVVGRNADSDSVGSGESQSSGPLASHEMSLLPNQRSCFRWAETCQAILKNNLKKNLLKSLTMISCNKMLMVEN